MNIGVDMLCRNRSLSRVIDFLCAEWKRQPGQGVNEYQTGYSGRRRDIGMSRGAGCVAEIGSEVETLFEINR